jgi:hypothetical protein
MRFSKKMWPEVHKRNPETQLLEIGKIIGQMWRETSEAEKAAYQQEYEAEKIEYDRNLKSYQAALANQHTIASRSRMSTSHNDGSAAIQAVDEEDPLEMTKKRLAAIRFERDCRLMSELFTGACLPDTRTMVPQSRIEQLKRQATSLSNHQDKLNGELEGLEQKFQKRKRALEESSEKFNQEMKKLKEEKPNFTEDKYREYAQLWTDYIKQQFADFKAGKLAPVEEAIEVTEEMKDVEESEKQDESTAETKESVEETAEENNVEAKSEESAVNEEVEE